jgi:cell division protein FtsB
MRGILLGGLGGLVIGVSGTYAYEHYLGDGQQLVQTQSQLSTANATLTKNTQDGQDLKNETTALSAQVQQLSSSNDDLKHQVEALNKTSTPSAPAPAANPMAGMMKVGMEQQFQQKLLMLKSRLHLTPEQEAAVKAAMDEEAKRMEDMFAGGKFDPAAMAKQQGANSVDKTLDSILTPDQKAIYKQIQDDEKSSAAETMATMEMNQVAPVLGLSDAQKDQVYSALYQVQTNMTDPNWIKNIAATGSDPMAVMEAQAKAKEDALAKILTPDQMATYQQQVQNQMEMVKSMMQKMTPPSGSASSSGGDSTVSAGVVVLPATP